MHNEVDAALLEALHQERFARAADLARARLAPPARGEAWIWGVLALALRGLGRDASEVIDCFEQGFRLGGAEEWMWTSFGTVLREAGRLEEAREAYLKAAEVDPNSYENWVNLGYLYIEFGFVVKARDALLRALALQPDLPEVRVHAAHMCLECGEDETAAGLLRGHFNWANRVDPRDRVDLASELIRLGDSREGQAMLHSLQADPACGTLAIVRLAAAQERLNDLAAARQTAALLPPWSHAVQADSTSMERAMLEAALAERAGEYATANRILLDCPIASAAPRSTQIALLYQHAKVCDKLGDTAGCLSRLAGAHARQLDVARQLVPGLLEPDSVPLGILDTRVQPAQYADWKRDPTAPDVQNSPLFVVGFPRSGTTMLEQMLDAHPGMRSMDEQPFVQRAIEKMESFGLRYPNDLAALDADQCAQMRAVYFDCVAKVLQLKPGQRLVDKNPLTMLRLPLLKRLFPESRIILVVRHPCDVLLSCYMQHFNAPAFSVLCSSIDRLARGYVRAMQFWFDQVKVLHPHVYEWRYEHVLDDFDGEIEKLASFLELADSAPLRDYCAHARAKGYIGTPSYSQVVQPLYKTARGRWQRYRAFFEPVLPIVEPVLQHWNYDVD